MAFEGTDRRVSVEGEYERGEKEVGDRRAPLGLVSHGKEPFFVLFGFGFVVG